MRVRFPPKVHKNPDDFTIVGVLFFYRFIDAWTGSVQSIFYFWEMKISAIILSSLILALSSYPCCQEDDACGIASYMDCDSGDDYHDKAPHKEDLPCSPFYTCGRCPGFTIAHESLFDIGIIELDLKRNQVPYHGFVSEEVYFYALKPPRI